MYPQHRVSNRVRASLRSTALAFALGGALASIAHAQTVTGSIFGQAPAEPNTSVIIRSLETGVTRTLSVDAQGRYRATDLPNGRYRVILQQNGADIATRDDVVVNIASGTEVSFAGGGDIQSLDRVEVRGISAPAIDISQVDTRTVLTYEQLQSIPIAHNATAAALLAPGAVASTNYNLRNGIPSFGGSAASENAYYINGYPVTNPLTALGYYQLPYESIAQQQMLTGGYGAEFGRSTGGVVNIVTQRGSNEWKAGVYTVWVPQSLRAAPRNQYYANTGHFPANDPDPSRRTDGTLRSYRNQNLNWQNTTGLYVGGPLLRDKVFFYGNVDFTRTDGHSVRYASSASPADLQTGWRETRRDNPMWMGKLDWYLTDNHLLELTAVSDVDKYQGDFYAFSYDDLSHGSEKTGQDVATKDDSRLYVARYTGHLSDSVTLSALYGRQKITHDEDDPEYDPNCPNILAGATSRAPGLVYGSCQPHATMALAGRFDETKGGRLDLTWQVGRHELHVGYDRMEAESHDGEERAGGYTWQYGRASNPNGPVFPAWGVTGSPASAGGLGVDGYFVNRIYITQDAQPRVVQEAQYIEDRWQVNDHWLLSFGLRNEQFSNYTGDGRQVYISQRHQLAPRLGAVWDVKGNSELKLFANAGRYHLTVPNVAAVRGAAASRFTREFFTYTGVDPNTGIPTGLTPIAVDPNTPYICPGLGADGATAVSANLECGQAPNPLTVSAIDLKSHYQDEYILGMEQALSHNMSWGAKLTYRTLKSGIDDICSETILALGISCPTFNPGRGNSFWVPQDDGSLVRQDFSAEELGMPALKRKYYALDLYWEQRSERWYTKVEYTLSRNYGNTEGQLNSDIATTGNGQLDVSRTQDWDLPALMDGANGLLPNHRAHVIKAFGYLTLTPEWRVGANVLLASGRPRNCTSMYPTDHPEGLYDGSYYWYCGLPGTNGGTDPSVAGYVPPSDDFGPSPRGSHGTTPWTYSLNLNLSWTPKWVRGLTLRADIMNVLNRQVPGYYNPAYAANPYRGPADYNPLYGTPSGFSTPRYLRFTARYDF